METLLVSLVCLAYYFLVFNQRHQKFWQGRLLYCYISLLCFADFTHQGRHFARYKFRNNPTQSHSFYMETTFFSGAYEGIKFYMVPDWSHLSNIKVWEAAAVQIFFSLSVAGGGLITLASYNPFKNNVLR